MKNQILQQIYDLIDPNRPGGVSGYELAAACTLVTRLDEKLITLPDPKPTRQKPQNFREWLNNELKDRNVSPDELAKATGIDLNSINDLLSGKAEFISLTQIRKIAGAFDIPSEMLLGMLYQAG